MESLRCLGFIFILNLTFGAAPFASAEEWTARLGEQGRESLKSSVHASVDCADCHSGESMDAHPARIPAVDCAICHSDVQEIYAASVHGRARQEGDTQAARCFDCHGSHDIRPKKDPQSKVYPFNIPLTCGVCHGLKNGEGHSKAKKTVEKYLDSIHGRVLTKSGLLMAAQCVSCHGAHEIRPKTEPGSKVHRGTVAATCGSCHAGILTRFFESVHGKKLAEGDTRAPACNTCHTAHDIVEGARPSYQLGVIDRCGTCHEEYLHTYRDNFHGKVTQLGFTFTAKCADCHAPHSILPATDTRSSVHASNLVETCRACHAGANENFVKFDPHANPADRKRNPILYWSYVSMTALLVGTFAFFGLHTLLWFLRETIEKCRARKGGGHD